MRDVLVFAIVFGALPFAFVRPFYGLLLFSWLAYMRAPDLTWGAARSFRFSAIVAAVMFLGWLLFDTRPFMRRDRRNWYMLAMTAAVTVSYFIAPLKVGSITPKFLEFLKVIAIAVFTTGQIDSGRRLRTLVWLIALSLGFYGIKGGMWGLLVQDARIIRGPGGLLLDNNDFSLAMVMNIPFLFYLAMSEQNRRVKLFLRVAVVLTVITIVLTGSRGGFLAMAVVFFAIVMKSRYKTISFTLAGVGLVLFLVLIPQEYKERIASIRTASRTDGSAIGRLHAWGVALNMIQAKPWFGVGFANFVSSYDRYDERPDSLGRRVAHNSYLQIWAESGSIAFFFFLASIFSTIFLMRRLRRYVRVRDGPAWLVHYSHMIEVTFYGFLVGATFLNRAHFDMLYQLVAIGASLGLVTASEVAAARRRAPRHGPATLVVRTADPFLGGAR